MILPLVILYVVTLVYLSITERFRNFASLIGLQGWLLFAIALVRLHAINPAELAFIAIETLLFKGILVPALLFAVIRLELNYCIFLSIERDGSNGTRTRDLLRDRQAS